MRRGLLLRLACVLAVALLASSCDALLHRSGSEVLYRKHCSDCHGLDGAGNTPQYMGNPYADLLDNQWKYGGDDTSIATVIRQGVFGQMPAFQDKLSDHEVEAVIRYLHVLRGERRPDPPGAAP